MLTREEALLMRAVQEEQENQQAVGNGLALGGLGGAALGAGIGNVPHQVGRGLNSLRGHTPARFKSGSRIAGGLTGLILGGGLGAGMAAMMKQNESGELLGKIQAQNGVTTSDEMALERILGELYSNPSQIG